MTDDDKKPTTVRQDPDPLGYDTTRPFRAVARAMAEDAIAGRGGDAVEVELAAVRRRWRRDDT